MNLFTQVLDLVKLGVSAFGMLWVVWGAVTLGVGIKDKTGPQIAQGFGTLVGGGIIVAAAQLISQIKM